MKRCLPEVKSCIVAAGRHSARATWSTFTGSTANLRRFTWGAKRMYLLSENVLRVSHRTKMGARRRCWCVRPSGRLDRAVSEAAVGGTRAWTALGRTYTAYPFFDRSRPRNVCGRFGRATALTEKNRSDSFKLCMETTTLHAQFDGRPTGSTANLRRFTWGAKRMYLLSENVLRVSHRTKMGARRRCWCVRPSGRLDRAVSEAAVGGTRAWTALGRTYTAYPFFDRSRPRNVCGRFGRATALTEKNRSDSFKLCMETTTLHAQFDGRPTNLLRLSCGSAKPYRRQKLRTRALHNENVRGGLVQP